VHELHDFFVHSEHEIEESVETEGSLGEKYFWRENRDFEPKGVDPPKEVTMVRGRECNAKDSRNHSRKYSQDLWEVTSQADFVYAVTKNTNSTGCSRAHAWMPTPCVAMKLELFECTRKHIQKHINNDS